MRCSRAALALFSVVPILTVNRLSDAGVQLYLSDGELVGLPEPADWYEAMSGLSAIDFVCDSNQPLNEQYSELGVLFTDGNDWVIGGFPELPDGWGASGGWDSTISLQFDVPQSAFAVEFPGDAYVQLLNAGELVFSSGAWGSGSSTGIAFMGVISDEPFDEVRIIDPLGGVFIDNIMWGTPVPAPGGAWLVAGALAIGRRGRRRQD